MKYGFIVLMILSVWVVTAEAADDKCVSNFQGCAIAVASGYYLCNAEENCDQTLEQYKEECMKKFPDCADRAFVEDAFKKAAW